MINSEIQIFVMFIYNPYTMVFQFYKNFNFLDFLEMLSKVMFLENKIMQIKFLINKTLYLFYSC